MNLLEGWVTRVLSTPYKTGHKNMVWWEVKIEYEDDGGVHTTTLQLDTEEEALKVDNEYMFLH